MKIHALPNSEGRFATGIRAIFLVALVALIAGITGLEVFGPQPELGAVDSNPAASAAAETAPDGSKSSADAAPNASSATDYFPAHFPSPKGPAEPQPPTF